MCLVIINYLSSKLTTINYLLSRVILVVQNIKYLGIISIMKSSTPTNSKKSIPSSHSLSLAPKQFNSHHNIQSNITTLNTSIPALQQQLRMLKLQQKKYNKLAVKLKDVQRRSKQISAQDKSQQLAVVTQTEQIENLKKQIDQCIKDTRRLEAETTEINKQIQQSGKQFNSLQIMLNSLREQNKQRRNNIKEKGVIYQQQQKLLQQIQRQRDECETDVQTVKLEVERLVSEEYKLRKEAEIVQFQQLQQEKAARKYQDYLQKLKNQNSEVQAKVAKMSMTLLNEEEKYKYIKQQLHMLNTEQNQIIEEVHRREEASRQNKEKIIRSRAKIESLSHQIENADNDIKLLSNQYCKETDRLRELQHKNTQLNEQLDQSCRDAQEVWDSLRQVLDVAAGNQDIWSLEALMKIRNQAIQTWNQIQSIIQ